MPAFLQGLEDPRPTGGAGLGGVPGIEGDHRPTSLCRFVGQDRQERAPSLIMDLPSQAALRQALKVERFYIDHIESPHQLGGNLEGMIPAHSADPLVLPRQQLDGVPASM
jgi:hypothetical protein